MSTADQRPVPFVRAERELRPPNLGPFTVESALSETVRLVQPSMRKVADERQRPGYDPRKLPCDEEVEAALATLALTLDIFLETTEEHLVGFAFLPMFEALLKTYAISAAWPKAPTWKLAAMIHAIHLATVRKVSAGGCSTDGWTARARRVADAVGPLRARIVMTYGHPGERVSMGKKRTRGHRLAAFVDDNEWAKVRRALGVDRTSVPAYEIEKISIKSQAVNAMREHPPASPLWAPGYDDAALMAALKPNLMLHWSLLSLGFAAPHGAPTAAARELIAEGLDHEPSIAAISGANERAVRKLLKGK